MAAIRGTTILMISVQMVKDALNAFELENSISSKEKQGVKNKKAKMRNLFKNILNLLSSYQNS